MASHLQTTTTAVIVPAHRAQKIRFELEKQHLWDETHRLVKLESNSVAIPVKQDEDKLLSFIRHWPELSVKRLSLPASKKVKVKENNPALQLRKEVEQLMRLHDDIPQRLLTEVPQKWERHDDLIIIPSTAFVSREWNKIGNDLWTLVAKSLSCKRLARHSPVADNGFRSSQVVMLLGHSGVVTHVDNGIRYSYDVTKCMFSAGNITEKLRVAGFGCSGETVVDLYAGIGYFTLPYLVHAKADHVHACEWNVHAVRALKQNLELNNVSARCTVHEGDNRLMSMSRISEVESQIPVVKDFMSQKAYSVDIPPVADRVNLGLIPSSEDGWPVAVRVLKPSGGLLHVHGNVTTILRDGSQENVVRENGELPNNIECQGNEKHSGGCCDNPEKDSQPKPEKADQALADASFQRENLLKVSKCDNSSCADFDYLQKHRQWNQDCHEKDKLSEKENQTLACQKWSNYVQERIKSLLEEMKGGQWTVRNIHLEIVKSYAPHVLHVVLDLNCSLLLNSTEESNTCTV